MMSRITLSLIITILALLSQLSSAKLSPHQLLLSSPSRPLGLIRHLHSHSNHAPPPPSITSDASSPQHHFTSPSPSSLSYTPHFFPQRISHDPKSPYFNQTFLQRYWFDNQFYQPGGPIFFLDGGETDGEGRLGFLKEGILRVLSEATGGMGVVHEHRYYGTSHPFSNLSVPSLQYLTTNQSLLDSAHFASSIQFPGMESQKLTARDVPWIYYGGSYAGGKSAFARRGWGWGDKKGDDGKRKGVWWGAIASSGVTVAIVDYWQYFETIRLSASPSCISSILNHTSVIDSLISLRNPLITSSLKNYFGLKDLTRIEDFVSTLSTPLGLWQARNWDKRLDGGGWEEFCESLLGATSVSPFSTQVTEEEEDDFLETIKETIFPGLPKVDLSSFSSYAKYIKENIVALCPDGETQDSCFSVDGYAANEGLEEAPWRSWLWQVCTEWGYFMPAPPEEERAKGLISKFITLEYTMEICKKAYGIDELPDVKKVNAFGGYELEAERLAFVDGSEDPWIYATPHSPLAKHPNRTSTLSKPFHLIPGAVHHWDENSLLPSTNPAIPNEIKEVHMREIEWVESWLDEWRERGRWKIDPDPDPDGGF